MSEKFDVKGILARINTNGDEKITQEELENAKGKVPSLWLEKIAALAAGGDMSVDHIIKGLGVEPEVRSGMQNQEMFHKERAILTIIQQKNLILKSLLLQKH